MDQSQLEAALVGLPFFSVRYYPSTGSTNDLARTWAEQGAPEGALVVAGKQTAGRGRLGRSWISPAGSSLSFSLVLRSIDLPVEVLPRLAGLGALAVSDALESLYALQAQIKWPNDVLIERGKVCGILPEVVWSGSQVQAVILGIGINTGRAVLEANVGPGKGFSYPPAALESYLGFIPDPSELLRAFLDCLLSWKPHLGSAEFLQAWEKRLAFKGEWVRVSLGGSEAKEKDASGGDVQEGQVVGLSADGSLLLRTGSGETISVRAGDLHLRPDQQPSPDQQQDLSQPKPTG
jgi:BirA family transcriptional regulator, biotin operon repressor / biotin---[acetyl-CoA-carboxylase] ligase